MQIDDNQFKKLMRTGVYFNICINCLNIEPRPDKLEADFVCKQCKQTFLMNEIVSFSNIAYFNIYNDYMYNRFYGNPKNKNIKPKLNPPDLYMFMESAWLLKMLLAGVLSKAGEDLYLKFKTWWTSRNKTEEVDEKKAKDICDYIIQKNRDFLKKNPNVFSKTTIIKVKTTNSVSKITDQSSS